MSARPPHAPSSPHSRSTTLSVEQLVTLVREGKIRIPAYQRPLRWKAADVLKLFDSVWRGFPVGSLIFWQHEAPAGEELVGGAEILVPSELDAWWVVDGQQRITSLAAGLLELDHRHDRRWEVFFDPYERAFVPWSPHPNDHAVPVSVLGDLQRLFLWIRERDLEPALIESIADARQQLLGYTIPVYVMETDDAELVRAAFVRINRSGASMRADEVFQALMAHPAQDRSRLDLDRLQGACDRNDFGMPSRTEVMKAVLAIGGVELVALSENLVGSALDPLVSYENVETALTSAVAFLQEVCGIPHVRLIPFMGILPTLARWFYIHGDPEPASISRLAQWVWRVSHVVAHRRPEISWVQEQPHAIERDGDEQAALDRLDALVGGRPSNGWKLDRFNARRIRSRIEILAMLAAEPCDRSGPVRLRALLSDGRIAREIIGSRGRDGSSPELAHGAANRALLDVDDELQSELRTWDPTKDEAALRSHLIGPAAFAALQASNHGEFLRLRAAALEDHVAGFLASHARWDDPVVRPHRYYSDDVLDQGARG